MNDIIVDLIDDYAERRKESFELLAIPGFLREIRKSQREIREGKGVSLDDVRKDLERKILSERSKKIKTPGS